MIVYIVLLLVTIANSHCHDIHILEQGWLFSFLGENGVLDVRKPTHASIQTIIPDPTELCSILIPFSQHALILLNFVVSPSQYYCTLWLLLMGCCPIF